VTRARAALASIALAVVLAGCGGTSADDVLERTTANVARVRSAELGLRLVLEPRSGRGRVGFTLRGPIELRSGRLPVARLAYTQIAGARQAGATFRSTGDAAFVDVAGTAYRLPKHQTDALARSAGRIRTGATLELGRWLERPSVEDGGTIDGTDTDHVSAKLDTVTALRDIFGAAAATGADVPDLGGARSDELRRAIKTSSIDVWSGHEDRFLRRLRLRIGFEVAPPRPLREQLGRLVGGRLAFDLDLTHINRPVRVDAPRGARPAAELGASGG
jgi:hypothetical protein